MKPLPQFVIIAAVALAVITTLALKRDKFSPEPTRAVAAASDTTKTTRAVPPVAAALPKLVDLGAGKCIPCKKMTPVLEELKQEFTGRLQVEFIDVWQNPGAAQPYKIEIIPTQIFYDAAGREQFRHVGFFSKAEILAKWKELGVDLAGK